MTVSNVFAIIIRSMIDNADKVLLFGGTTEARDILNHKIPAIYSVVSDYGAELVKNIPGVEILIGRLNEDDMINLIKSRKIKYVIDATHPYAVDASKNIKSACQKTNSELLRVIRPENNFEHENITRVDSIHEAVKILRELDGNIFIATGSKELEFLKEFSERAYIRVLPDSEILARCEALGFRAGHVIAMQGNFSYELNKSMFEAVNAKILLTKDGGSIGGIRSKIDAAKFLNMKIILIDRPIKNESGVDVRHAILWARRKLNLTRPPLFPLMLNLEDEKILIIGGGKIAKRRCETLIKCGAYVTVIAPEFCENFPESERIIKRVKKFEPLDLTSEYKFVIAASNDHELNLKIKAYAKKINLPVNIADDVCECDFYFPAIVNENNISVSISSAGINPSLTHKIADKLRENLYNWVN